MNKKGFTLIELLAVIVILAILALIVTPIVINIINKAQEGADKRSIEGYAKVIEEDYLNRKLNDSSLTPDDYILNYASDATYNGDKIVCINQYLENNDIVLEKCTVNGRGYYNYKNGKVTKGEDKPDEENSIPEPKSFSEDSWKTIIENVKNGNTSAYNVGDEKEIKLSGFTNGESGSNGLYTVRIANTSTPQECSQEGFSQTACGFVIEFVDIITKNYMNSPATNVGGWKASSMRTYINVSIYESFPEEIRDNIIYTTVVSGQGYSDSTNFISTDKLYLLAEKEVYRKEGTSNVIEVDTSSTETRQLDYYKNIGVTTSNYSGAIKKYNGNTYYWWLRSADYVAPGTFMNVYNTGNSGSYGANAIYRVAPAFRIG